MASFEAHGDEDVERSQTVSRPYFHGGEVDGRDGIPVGLKECFPGGLVLANWCRFDAVLLEDVSDRAVGNLVAEISEGPLDTVVAPSGVFLGKAENESSHAIGNRRSSRSSPPALAVVPFRGDEASVPAQNRVWCHDGGQLGERLAPMGLALDREDTRLVIGEESPLSSHLFDERSNLGVLKFDDLLLLLIHPAGENYHDELPWSEDGFHGIADSEDGRNLRELPPSQQSRVG